jgi:hypothetical protein
MNRRQTALFSIFSASLLLSACGGATTADEEIAYNESQSLAVAECDVASGRGCEDGESCLAVGRIGVCATNRCTSSRECRDGYVCRADHCLRVEREPDRPDDTRPDDTRPDDTRPDDTRPDDTRPDDRACPRGSVPGITACAEGYTSHVVSRDPLCSTCEEDRPTRPDRCDGASPSARGDCRQILGWYYNGRTCVPLGGCVVTDAQGLYRTERGCAEDHLRCH